MSRMVAECDDLVFDPDMAEFSPGVVNGIVGLEQTRKTFANNRAALQKFSRISTSTEPLAEELQSVFPKAKVIVKRVPHIHIFDGENRQVKILLEKMQAFGIMKI